MKRWFFPLIIDLLPGEGEPPAPAAPPADPPAAPPAAPAPAAPPATPQAGLLKPAAPAAPAAPEAVVIPEKFLVKTADGKEDWKAIAEKTAASYTEIEKRFRGGEAPPKTPDEYKIENYLPEGYERNLEREKGVLAGLHKVGLSNAQAQGVLGLYGELLGNGMAEHQASMETAMQSLKTTVWKQPGEFERNLERANMALSLAPEVAEEIANNPQMMNSPALIRLLAKLGAEFEDDRSAEQMDAGEIESLESLRNSPAYLDAKHPDHKRTVAKVNAGYERGFKVGH